MSVKMKNLFEIGKKLYKKDTVRAIKVYDRIGVQRMQGGCIKMVPRGSDSARHVVRNGPGR